MLLYIKRKNGSVNATLDYNENDGTFIVLKGSIVAKNVSTNVKFRSAKAIEKARGNGIVENGIVLQDVAFKSASTAANFVTGNSTNGRTAWRDISGKTLKELEDEEMH